MTARLHHISASVTNMIGGISPTRAHRTLVAVSFSHDTHPRLPTRVVRNRGPAWIRRNGSVWRARDTKPNRFIN